MSDTSSEKKKGNKGLVAIIIILLLVIAGMGWMLFQNNETIDNKDSELAEISADLQASLDNLATMESDNDSMDAYIVNKEAQLTALLDSVQNAKDASDRSLARWKNAAYEYKAQITELQADVDSIKAAYQELSIENEQTKVNLAQEIQNNEELKGTVDDLNNTVAEGAQLQLTSIYAGAYKVYSSGEEDETSRARRAERIKTCITIGANPIAEKGEREVVMRVVSPNQKVIAAPQDSTGTNQFNVNGNNLLFSARQNVWFENEAKNVCLSMDYEDFDEGTYQVEIYIDGQMVQEARFVLD